MWLMWLQRAVQQRRAILSMDANDVHNARTRKVPGTGGDLCRARAPGTGRSSHPATISSRTRNNFRARASHNHQCTPAAGSPKHLEHEATN